MNISRRASIIYLKSDAFLEIRGLWIVFCKTESVFKLQGGGTPLSGQFGEEIEDMLWEN